jgi:hypothetical protein
MINEKALIKGLYSMTSSKRRHIFLHSFVGSKMQYSGLIPFCLKKAFMFLIKLPDKV